MRKPNRMTPRRFEAVDSKPMTLPVKFQRPPSLAEQIARYMAAHERYAASQEEEFDDDGADLEDFDDVIESPHELVHDPLLNRDIPRHEFILLQRERAVFDKQLSEKVRQDKLAAAEAKKLKEAMAEAARHKKSAKSAPADDET